VPVWGGQSRQGLGGHPVFWIRADATANTTADFVLLATHLGLGVRDASKPDAVASDVKRWLARTPGWLLVFDNADHPDAVGAFLPDASHHGRVLVTTRCQSAAGATLVPLDGMDTDEGVQLLATRARIDTASQSAHDVQVCRDLVSQMGGLPLALDQAGASIEERKCGMQRYAALRGATRRCIASTRPS